MSCCSSGWRIGGQAPASTPRSSLSQLAPVRGHQWLCKSAAYSRVAPWLVRAEGSHSVCATTRLQKARRSPLAGVRGLGSPKPFLASSMPVHSAHLPGLLGCLMK